MKPIVECVPNFSEGRDPRILAAIGDSIERVRGVRLLNIEPDKDYNRVVVTFAGDPTACVDAALASSAVALEMIDMRKHKGEHPRMGAIDVVPFVPVAGVTMADCVRLSEQYAERASSALGLPIYLYAQAARRPERRKLPDIRKGEYEMIEKKLSDSQWAPDYGPSAYSERIARSGVTAAGARFFLIAYNVNLATTDVDLADEIAFRVRESGRPQKDAQGNVMKDANGKTLRIPGSLRETQAKGIYLDAHKMTQVSMNLLNYLNTGIHTAFEECRKEAKSLGTHVTGSEIVGIVPKDSLTQAGEFYAQKRGTSADEQECIRLATDELGLNQLAAFDPSRKIIDYMIS